MSSSPSNDTGADLNPYNVADAADAAAAAEQDAKVAKLHQMIGLVWSDDDDSRREGTIGIWKLLSAEGGSGLFHQVEQSGAVGRLVEFLEIDDSPNLQFVAACVISTIASSENTLAVVKHGAVPNLLKLLHSTVDTNREKAVEALGKIARGDSPDCRETLLSSGAFEALLPHLSEDAESSMVKIAIRALSKFWSAKPIPSFCQTELVVDVIQRLIGSSDDELVSEACWALFHISHESKDNLGGNNVNGACISHMLVKLLGHRNQSVLYPTLQAAIVLTAGDEFRIQRMINDKVLPHLVNLLTNDYEMRIKNDACWFIWNITISEWQKEAVVASGAISALVNLLQNPEFDTKKKAAWAITNVTY